MKLSQQQSAIIPGLLEMIREMQVVGGREREARMNKSRNCVFTCSA